MRDKNLEKEVNKFNPKYDIDIDWNYIIGTAFAIIGITLMIIFG